VLVVLVPKLRLGNENTKLLLHSIFWGVCPSSAFTVVGTGITMVVVVDGWEYEAGASCGRYQAGAW